MTDPCLQMDFVNWVIELWYLTPLLAIFQLYCVVALSFIGGVNLSTQRKPSPAESQ